MTHFPGAIFNSGFKITETLNPVILVFSETEREGRRCADDHAGKGSEPSAAGGIGIER